MTERAAYLSVHLDDQSTPPDRTFTDCQYEGFYHVYKTCYSCYALSNSERISQTRAKVKSGQIPVVV